MSGRDMSRRSFLKAGGKELDELTAELQENGPSESEATTAQSNDQESNE